MQDVVERIWDFIDDFNINSVLKFLRDNIVGTVVLVSLLFWVPISCLISYVDRKRAEKVCRFLILVLPFDTFLLTFNIHHQDEEEWEWKRRDELIHPNDRRRIIHLRVPRRNVVASTMHGGGGAAPTHPMHQDVYGTREIHCNPSQSAI